MITDHRLPRILQQRLGGAAMSEKSREMFEWLDQRFGKECGHNHSHDNDPLPYSQGARPDTYKYLDAELAAAEERGRRSMEMEARTLLTDIRYWIAARVVPYRDVRESLLARIDAALAPRDSGKEQT